MDAKRIEQRFDYLRQLEADWDHFGAKSIDEMAIWNAERFIEAMQKHRFSRMVSDPSLDFYQMIDELDRFAINGTPEGSIAISIAKGLRIFDAIIDRHGHVNYTFTDGYDESINEEAQVTIEDLLDLPPT